MSSLDDAYAAQVREIRKAIASMASDMWHGLPHYRDDSVRRLEAALLPRVRAGQLQIAQLTDAYLQMQMREMGIWFEPGGVLPGVTQGRGVAPEDVYRRPFVTAYSALKEGKPLALAVAAGATRLTDIVLTDMQMAKVRQAQATLGRSDASMTRRVLNGSTNCPLCVVASTQPYKATALLPIHPGCDCGVKVIPEYTQADAIADDDLLEQTHSLVQQHLGVRDRSARHPDYRKAVLVQEHGEYGPTLTWADQNFTKLG